MFYLYAVDPTIFIMKPLFLFGFGMLCTVSCTQEKGSFEPESPPVPDSSIFRCRGAAFAVVAQQSPACAGNGIGFR